MNPPGKTKFVCLAILDGWGIAPPGPGNATSMASTVNFNRYIASYPHTELEASGQAVGLPQGEAGNTETGHLNLGAGRIVYQDLLRINMSIADGTFAKNAAFLAAIEHAKKNNSKLHLMGLIGGGGVHSNAEHLYALIQLAAKNDFKNIFIHLFTDGRDSPQTASQTYIKTLREVIAREGVGQIASIMGRYWAMDRDFRWDRTAKAYEALTKGVGHLIKTPEEAITMSYDEGKTDEFIEPSLVSGADGKPIALIQDGDAIIFYNFRIDRPRQLTSAFVIQDFHPGEISWDFDPYSDKYNKSHLVKQQTGPVSFQRGSPLNNIYFVSMTEYSKFLSKEGAHPAYPPEMIDMPLGRVIAEHELRQLRVAESEKERFVTYYFNGMQDLPFNGEDRIIIPSPKVATYDLKPDMSARETTKALLDRLSVNSEYSFVLINFANADMVGHTGNIGAASNACSVVDECIGQIANFVLGYGGTLLITADHGNVEEMINPHTGQIDTEHNNSHVPFIAISQEYAGKPNVIQSGILADIAPTVLKLLGIEVPTSMTGRNLLEGL